MNPPSEGARPPGSKGAPQNQLTAQAKHTSGAKSIRRKRRISKQLAVVRAMPPLPHWPDRTEPFDARNSEVCRWLTQQPDLLNWIFRAVKERGLISFDKQSRTWRGTDFAATLHNAGPEVLSIAPSREVETVALLRAIADSLTAIRGGQLAANELLQSIVARMP